MNVAPVIKQRDKELPIASSGWGEEEVNFNKAWDKDKKKDNDKDKGLGNRICIKISNCLLFTLVNQHKLLDPNVQLI